jgi:hypothetical protein
VTAISFASAADLEKHVNDNAIANADITQIVFTDGRWWLFHF